MFCNWENYSCLSLQPWEFWGYLCIFYFFIISNFKEVARINHLCIFDPHFCFVWPCVCVFIYTVSNIVPHYLQIFYDLYPRNKDVFLHNNSKLFKSGNSVLVWYYYLNPQSILKYFCLSLLHPLWPFSLQYRITHCIFLFVCLFWSYPFSVL